MKYLDQTSYRMPFGLESEHLEEKRPRSYIDGRKLYVKEFSEINRLKPVYHVGYHVVYLKNIGGNLAKSKGKCLCLQGTVQRDSFADS